VGKKLEIQHFSEVENVS